MSDVNTDLPQGGGPHTRPNRPAEGADYPGLVPTGEQVAPHNPPLQTPQDHGVPAGVIPEDPSGPAESVVPGEHTGAPYKKGKRPYSVDNGFAFAVNQRKAHDWRGGVTVVDQNSGGTAIVVSRRPGRTQLRLWVTSSMVVGGTLVTGITQGVLVAPSEGELQQGGGFLLNVGDPPVLLESEGIVWVGLMPGNSVGYVQWLDLFDIPGGSGLAI